MKKGNKEKIVFKNWFVSFLKRNYMYIIMIALVILRIGLGWAMGAWYGVDQECDEIAMFNGLSPGRLIHQDYMSLIKDLNFSLFLGLSSVSGLPYTVFLSLFWALVAFVAWLLAKKVCKNKWLTLFIFSYVLFLPTAFDSWGGLRVYRNSIIVPCIILMFSLVLMLLVDLIKKESYKKMTWTAIMAGLSVAFLYYLQEDGTWIMACMLVFLIICFWIIGYRVIKKRGKGNLNWKKIAITAGICLIPFVALFAWGNIYKSVNNVVFGVYETNTRTNGELAEYVQKTYIIDSPNRSKVVWSPYDAIAATFEASPTLQGHKEILENIRRNAWSNGDAENNPLPREFLGWAIRVAVSDAGLWTSEKDVSDLFRQVNNELDEAFRVGSLKKAEGRIQLLKSAGAYTWDEIFDGQMMNHLLMSFRDAVWLEGYSIGFAYNAGDTDYTRDNSILHMSGDINRANGKKRVIGGVLANILAWAYRVVNIGLLVIAIAFIIKQMMLLIKNWKDRAKYVKRNRFVLSLALTSFMFLGITLVYSFGISWFFTEEFARRIFIFYHVGMSGLLVFVYMPAIIGVNELYNKKNGKVKELIRRRRG